MKYAFRRLTRAPGFATVAILTVALGIGANTAIFSLVQAVLLDPLPYGRPDRLVMLWGASDRGVRDGTTNLSGPEVRDYMAESRTFASVAAYTGTAANLTGGQQPERVVAAQVTPNIFATLGVPALVGRSFAADDRAPDIADQVVLGYRLWQRRFGGDRALVGQRILVNGAAALVVGVMPDGFQLPLDYSDDQPSELWQPLNLAAQFPSWGDHSLTGIARLADRVGPGRATAAMRSLEDRWIHDNVGGGWNDKDPKRRAAVPLKDLVVGNVRPALWTLLGAVGVILLIACANVANLMLARSDERSREIAVRTAIGASRGRIVRQLLGESVLLSVLGGTLGLALAWAAMRVLVASHPPGIPRLDQTGIDAGVLAFTLLLTVATGVLFGLAPAIELSGSDRNQPLKSGGRSGTSGARDVLAVSQIGLSVVLLVGALLIIRSFVELRRIDLGFDQKNALTMRVVLSGPEYAKDADAIRAIRTIQARLSELPGVRSVGATRLLPLTGHIGDWSITQEGRTKQPGENPNGDWQVVTPGYFETMGIRLVRGRFFTETDTETAPVVAVISEAMAAKYWPNEDPIG
ncbi:MAG TPA: ABC transporter permease, partial [Vicinamibacterales bacterium]|nr:ABC transporter permease [Vicinamibacterales bacterium]